MDRNQITGLVLMLVIIGVYFQFFAPEVTPPIQEPEKIEEVMPSSSSNSVNTVASIVPEGNDSIVNSIHKERFGLFAGFASGTEKITSIENDVLKIEFSNKGGNVKSVLLKDFLTFDKKPLYLFDETSNKRDLILTSNYKSVNLSELYFNTENAVTKVSGEDSLTISFTIPIESGRFIEQKYTLGGAGYELLYEVNVIGLDGVIDNVDAQFRWSDKIKKVEQSLKDSRARTTVNYYTLEEGFDNVSISDKPESEVVEGKVKWIAFKQKFFTAGFISENPLSKVELSTSVDLNDSSIVKTTALNITLSIGDMKTGKGKFKYYFGPNSYQITKKVTEGFGENVELGWMLFRYVNKFLVIPVFDFLQNYISNYGIIIIILVFAIRLLLAPLTWTSHMSMAKMKVLKPEMDVIKEKNEGDAQKTQQETMDLYRKAGINPLSGCIPMLLQFPFLLAMYNFFPNSIELRQKAFLWAHDLSTYDSIFSWDAQIPLLSSIYGNHISLFCLLMTGSTLLYTWSNSQMNSQLQGPMKTMQYIMPVMFLFFLNSYSAGLTFYYFVSNIVSFGQMAVFKKFVDEDKIKLVMEENRKKNANKSKSKFQLKLEEAMKAGEERKKGGKKK